MEAWKYGQQKDCRKSESAFDRHIQCLYNMPSDKIQDDFGVHFFESWGYYDTLDTNTIDTFLAYSGLDDFWGHRYDSTALRTPIEFILEQEEAETKQEVYDDHQRVEAGIVATKADIEAAYENFESDMKSIKSLETIVSKSITNAIPAFTEESTSGYLLILRPTRRTLQSSWSKRWCVLTQGELRFLKRAFWKIPKGRILLSSIERLLSINDTDFQIEYCHGRSILCRTKSRKESQTWLAILRRHKRNNTSSAA